MAAPEYRFLDRWFVPDPIGPVYDLMVDVYGYPSCSSRRRTAGRA